MDKFFLENVIVKGTRTLQMETKNILVPVDDDYVFVGIVKAYNPTTGMMTVNKLWDTSTTKKDLYAIAVYPGKSGIPKATEIKVGSWIPIYRTGIGNNVNGAVRPTKLQGHSYSADSASFIVFIRTLYVEAQQFKFSQYYIFWELGGVNPGVPYRTTIDSVDGAWVGYALETALPTQYSHAVPSRVRWASGWLVKFYDNYNSVTKEYSGFYWETPHTGWNVNSGNNVFVIQAGTGTANKTDLYPQGVHPYSECTVEKYIEICENQGQNVVGQATSGSATTLYDNSQPNLQYIVEIGDTIVTEAPNRSETITAVFDHGVQFAAGDPIVAGQTLFTIFLKSRKSWYKPEYKCKLWSPWEIKAGGCYAYYDPTADRFYYAFECPVPGVNHMCIMGGMAHTGINDEADQIYIYAVFASYGKIPGTNIDASLYTIKTTYVSGHEYDGGLVYALRSASDWQSWNGTAWQQAVPNEGSNSFHVGDTWNGMSHGSVNGSTAVGGPVYLV